MLDSIEQGLLGTQRPGLIFCFFLFLFSGGPNRNLPFQRGVDPL